MYNHATEPMTGHREHELEHKRQGGSQMAMIRRRPFRSLLIGAGIAMAVGMIANRRSKGQDGQQGQQRAQQGTREAKRQTLLAWLNDAYSMEKSLAQTLKGYIHDARGHTDVRARLEQHLDETRHHAELVKECIERQGGKTSALKSGMSSVMGTVQGAATMPAKDTMVKNFLAQSAAERFEIASYRGIITAADEIGDSDTARVCRQILREEESMSEWLEQHLPSAIREQIAQA